ncbi:MAG TPA: hypothetical protein VKG45_05425 [Actinomycetes bacterium]|nr:hypothetical protein [Actinomycetes bacterium]
MPVHRLDAETLDRFYAELRRRGRHDGKALSASQVRATHGPVRRARAGVAWGWIAHNPARLATPPSMPRDEVTPPPVEQVAGLLATAQERDPKFALFLRLAVVLGARRGELCALRWSAIDLDRAEVLLERGVVQVVGEPLLDKATKTRGKRRLAVDARTVELAESSSCDLQLLFSKQTLEFGLQHMCLDRRGRRDGQALSASQVRATHTVPSAAFS